MKKLIGLALLLAACHRATPATPLPSSVPVGAASPNAAVTAFLASVKDGDLQAMSAVWGTTDGTIRNQMPLSEIEKRETYIMKCTRHDKFTIVSEASAGEGERLLVVQLTRGPLTRSTNFTAVQGPQNRWYVRIFDLKPLDDICLSR